MAARGGVLFTRPAPSLYANAHTPKVARCSQLNKLILCSFRECTKRARWPADLRRRVLVPGSGILETDTPGHGRCCSLILAVWFYSLFFLTRFLPSHGRPHVGV